MSAIFRRSDTAFDVHRHGFTLHRKKSIDKERDLLMLVDTAIQTYFPNFPVAQTTLREIHGFYPEADFLPRLYEAKTENEFKLELTTIFRKSLDALLNDIIRNPQEVIPNKLKKTPIEVHDLDFSHILPIDLGLTFRYFLPKDLEGQCFFKLNKEDLFLPNIVSEEDSERQKELCAWLIGRIDPLLPHDLKHSQEPFINQAERIFTQVLSSEEQVEECKKHLKEEGRINRRHILKVINRHYPEFKGLHPENSIAPITDPKHYTPVAEALQESVVKFQPIIECAKKVPSFPILRALSFTAWAPATFALKKRFSALEKEGHLFKQMPGTPTHYILNLQPHSFQAIHQKEYGLFKNDVLLATMRVFWEIKGDYSVTSSPSGTLKCHRFHFEDSCSDEERRKVYRFMFLKQ